MQAEFKQSTPIVFCIIFAVITSIIGAAFLLIEPWISALIWLLGIGIPLAVWYFHTSYVIRCTDQGFTVDQKSRRKGEKNDSYAWSDVTETRYYEIQSRNKDGHTSTTVYFEAHVPSGTAFKVGRIRRFREMIQLFNENTPHLPYTWERQGGFTLSIGSLSAGKSDYAKVPRAGIAPPLPTA